MKHLQRFKIFESARGLTQEQEKFLDRCVEGSWTLNPEGKIDVEGNFLGHLKQLTDFKGLKFGRVTGYFRCDNNDLTSLVGAPSTVGGDFLCYNNSLTSLVGAPSVVRGNFWCYNNSLTSLEGAPPTVGGDFWCYSNSLTSLEGSPSTFGGDFLCYDNDLTSLVGAPSSVGGDFFCYTNRLTSLEGGPQEVGGRYDCDPNENLVSLKGTPEILKGSFVGPGGIRIPAGDWSLGGIIKAWKKDEDPRRKALLGTLLTKERLQKTIDSDPASALADLKNHFSDPWFRALDLKWPGKMGPWVDLMGDAGELGF